MNKESINNYYNYKYLIENHININAILLL